jgi:predicted MFS family arabinose efflux permease
MSRATRLPLAGVAFLALADTGVVALALPPLLRELDTTVAGVAAVLGVYALVLALALPLAETARRLAARPVAVAGVATFALASLACGVVDSLPALLLFRAVQAAGGAAVLVTAYAALSGGPSGARVWGPIALVGTLAGPAIGGALTQALGWRSIFLLQAPAAALALPAALAMAPARDEPRRRDRPARATVAAWVALALLSGALAAALFLTVLLLVSGWSVEPLAAAAAVSVMPLAALAVSRAGGPPAARAGAGTLLVAAGTASLAFVPTSDVRWTLLPQLLVGVGAGLALPALAGELLPERGGRDAARLLSLRHAGIALVLALLAPIAQHELDTTLADTRERGAALILDARLDPQVKLAVAPDLASGVQSEDPRGGLADTFDAHRGEVAGDQLAAYDELRRRTDETLVGGVNDGFSLAFLAGGALALLAAVALAVREPVRRPALATAAVAAAIAVPVAYGVAATGSRPAEVAIVDPCDDRDLPGSGGPAGFVQDAALRAADHVACEAGSSREELVLALVDDGEAERYERRYGVDPRNALDLVEVALP